MVVWNQYPAPAASGPSATPPQRLGCGAQRIETATTNSAGPAQIAVGANGDAFAVWPSFDGARNNTWANRYAIATHAWETATLIESGNAGITGAPHVAVDANGNAVAAWSYFDGARYDILVNRFSAAGKSWDLVTPSLTATATGSGDAPRVALDDAGNATVVWAQSDAGRYSIWANRFTAARVGHGRRHRDRRYRGRRAAAGRRRRTGNAIAVWYQFGRHAQRRRLQPIHGRRRLGHAAVLETGAGTALRPHVAVNASGAATAVWDQHDGARSASGPAASDRATGSASMLRRPGGWASAASRRATSAAGSTPRRSRPHDSCSFRPHSAGKGLRLVGSPVPCVLGHLTRDAVSARATYRGVSSRAGGRPRLDRTSVLRGSRRFSMMPSAIPSRPQGGRSRAHRRRGASALRGRGLSAVSIPELMKAIGLTHGGFYSHFESRDALVARRSSGGRAERPGVFGDDVPLADALRTYLSQEHVAHPEAGCVVAALRRRWRASAQPVRRAFANVSKGLLRLVDRKLRPTAQGCSGAERRGPASHLDHRRRRGPRAAGDDPALAQRLLGLRPLA